MAKKPQDVSATKPPETWEDVREQLAAELPEEAVERSKGAQTGKGYDTTGYGYQYVVNRFNDVVGLDGWTYEFEIIKTDEGQSKSGQVRYMVTVTTKITITFKDKTAVRACAGGHVSNNYADAVKGAITNSFKKTAALFGVGKSAYEGTIDDDNKAPDDGDGIQRPLNRTTPPPPRTTGGTSGSAYPLKGPVSDKQLGMIHSLLAKKGGDAEKIKAHFKIDSMKKLTKEQASKLIEQLMAKPDVAAGEEDVIQTDAPTEEQIDEALGGNDIPV